MSDDGGMFGSFHDTLKKRRCVGRFALLYDIQETYFEIADVVMVSCGRGPGGATQRRSQNVYTRDLLKEVAKRDWEIGIRHLRDRRGSCAGWSSPRGAV